MTRTRSARRLPRFRINLSVGRKLALAFGVTVALTTALGVCAVRQLTTLNASTTEIADNWIVSVRTLGEVSQATLRYRLGVRDVALAPDSAARAAAAASVGALGDSVTAARQRYEVTVS